MSRRLHPVSSGNAAGRMEAVSELSPEDRLVLANMVANARLEGQELAAEDVELAAAYLAGEIDSATYEQRLLDLVARRGEPEPAPPNRSLAHAGRRPLRRPRSGVLRNRLGLADRAELARAEARRRPRPSSGSDRTSGAPGGSGWFRNL